MVAKRNNILIVRLPTPNRGKIPNGRTFFSKYERINKVIYLQM